MRISPKAARNWKRILPFGIIWLVNGVIFLFVEHAATGFQNLNPDTAVTVTPAVLFFALIAVTVVGWIMGGVEIILLEKRFARVGLGRKIVYKFLLYILFVYLIMALTYPLAEGISSGMNPLSQEVLTKTGKFFKSLTFMSTMVQIGFSIMMCLLYSAISENLGHQVLLNFFTGKYHKPVVERRVFMFLDMKSSTTIAERLGHVQWFKLLDMYYDAMSDAIIAHRGEVYQYIGDEIVVSWKEAEGLRGQNCVRCYYAILESMTNRGDEFMRRFGVVPEFRAGIHLGEVTTGEIGALKKEIFFTGDVLNTTARVQAECKKYESDLLITGELRRQLDEASGIDYSEVGHLELRGKSERVTVYEVRAHASTG